MAAIMNTDLQKFLDAYEAVREHRAPAYIDGERALVEKEGENKDKVTLRFSSENPIRMSFGGFFVEEILNHKRGSVDLSRMNDGANLLFNHNRDEPIGVVERGSAKIKGRVGECVVRFGKSENAREKMEDVADDILTKVSVGYRIKKRREEEVRNKDTGVLDGVRIYVDEWEPTEVSMVTVPADATAEVMRSLEKYIPSSIKEEQINQPEGNDMSDNENKEKNVPALSGARSEEEIAAAAKELAGKQVADERERVAEIEATAEAIGASLPAEELMKLRKEAIKENRSAREFHTSVIGKIKELTETDPGALNPSAKLDMSRNERKRYSFAKAIAVAAGVIDPDKDAEAGFVRECHEEAQKRSESNRPNSIIVPFDVLVPPKDEATREQVAGTAGAGGNLVGTQHRGDYYIENLRDKAYTLQAGITQLSGLRQKISIPRKTSSAAFSFKAESANATKSNLAFDNVDLAMKTAAGRLEFSRDLIMQSIPEVEGICMRDLAYGAALAIDSAVLAGSGAADNPRGVINTTGVNTIAAAAPDWAKIVQTRTELATDNALMGRLAYFMSPATQQRLMTTNKSGSTYPVFLMENPNELMGYPAYVKSGDLGDNLVFGNWEEVLCGFWNMLELQRDTATNVQRGGVAINAYVDMDVGVRHATSFVVFDTTA